jgi:uncharacterized protein YceH (UPF0502 family)
MGDVMNKELIKSILLSLEDNKQPRHEDYNVEESEWNETAKFLKDKEYIKSITISRNTKYMFAEITDLGKLFLKQL